MTHEEFTYKLVYDNTISNEALIKLLSLDIGWPLRRAAETILNNRLTEMIKKETNSNA